MVKHIIYEMPFLPLLPQANYNNSTCDITDIEVIFTCFVDIQLMRTDLIEWCSLLSKNRLTKVLIRQWVIIDHSKRMHQTPTVMNPLSFCVVVDIGCVF